MDLEEYSAEDRLEDLEKEREELREQVFKDAQLEKLDNPEGPTVVNSPAEKPATA